MLSVEYTVDIKKIKKKKKEERIEITENLQPFTVGQSQDVVQIQRQNVA